jgi:hypothetical protein
MSIARPQPLNILRMIASCKSVINNRLLASEVAPNVKSESIFQPGCVRIDIRLPAAVGCIEVDPTGSIHVIGLRLRMIGEDDRAARAIKLVGIEVRKQVFRKLFAGDGRTNRNKSLGLRAGTGKPYTLAVECMDSVGIPLCRKSAQIRLCLWWIMDRLRRRCGICGRRGCRLGAGLCGRVGWGCSVCVPSALSTSDDSIAGADNHHKADSHEDPDPPAAALSWWWSWRLVGHWIVWIGLLHRLVRWLLWIRLLWIRLIVGLIWALWRLSIGILRWLLHNFVFFLN